MGRSNLLFASLLGAVAGPLLSDAFSLDRNAVGGVVRPRPQQLQRASQQAQWENTKSNNAIQKVSAGGTSTHSSAVVFADNKSRRRSSYLSASTSASTEPTSAGPPILGGTEAFETWFTSSSVGGKQQPGLRHATFQSDTLRGLEYSSSKERGVVQVPESVVLRTDYNRNSNDGRPDEGWDARLAVMLVKECLKGEESDLAGYCSLLTRGVPFDSVAVPPPTAPDALRHWTPQQKARLQPSRKGERLLKREKSQMRLWNDLYDDLPPEDASIMSREQFLWAMEAVNSRAFKGNFGGGLLNQLQRLTIPIIAAAFGAIVLLTNPGDATAELIAQVCTLAVLAPAILSLAEETGGTANAKADAVLLPYIDSANHSDDADSNIEYDPVNGIFILDIGKKCKVLEDDGRTQLYINYGKRTDMNLLLDYGFLTNMSAAKKNLSDDERRARLAKEFVRRNS
mmetsp:Transcript_13844/g.39794  ORF Transcript_13844/g.39794 Transcript_13844/m.39794 type:complete len:455 (+) Transcript_13844:66-1430(+)